eukprot:5346204-Amphidinium_carterae.1
MKLKKFLLRYEPPGVGLEVEHADGDIDVRHKDLPSTNGNWSGSEHPDNENSEQKTMIHRFESTTHN